MAEAAKNRFEKYVDSESPAQPKENRFSKYVESEPVPSPKSTGPKSYQWGEVPGAMLGNVGKSGEKFYTGLAEAVTSPVQTVDAIDAALTNLTNFLFQKPLAMGGETKKVEEANKFMKEMKNALLNRYGGEEELKRTLAEDPIGVLADVSTAFSGGALVAPKAATGLRKAAKFTDPLTPVVGVLGATGSMIGSGAEWMKNVADPKAAALMKMADGKAPDILNALTNYQTYVKGSVPTAAQAASAANVPTFTSFAASAKNVLPNAYSNRALEQAEAQRRALGTVAKTEADLAAAKQARKTEGDVNYEEAQRAIPRADPALATIWQDPFVQKVAPEAADLSQSMGFTFKQNPIGYLHNVKTRLDAAITAEKDATTQRQMLKKRDELVGWMESKSPPYRKARERFAEQSGPINRMEVGQYLENKLVPALMMEEATPGLRAEVFARALEEAPTTLKKSTGYQRYQKLTDVLTPEEMKVVEGIRDDLARSHITKYQAGNAKASKTVAYDLKDFYKNVVEDVKAPTMVNPLVTLTNDIIKRTKGAINSRMAVELAEAMLNPETAAEALRSAMAREKRLGRLAAVPKEAGKAVMKVARKTPPAAINMLSGEENQNALNQ
jgi:hypothetical protein